VAVIIDLDQTMVNSSHLDLLRRRRQWNRVYEQISACTAYQGITEILQELNLHGIPVCIVTSSPRPYVERVLRHYNWTVDASVCFHDTVQHKPHPAPIEKAIEHLDVSPDDCVSIGDSPDDIVASRSAGVQSIGALWGTKSHEALLNSNPDYICSTVDDLRMALRKRFALNSRGLVFRDPDDDVDNKIFALGYYIPARMRRQPALVPDNLVFDLTDTIGRIKRWRTGRVASDELDDIIGELIDQLDYRLNDDIAIAVVPPSTPNQISGIQHIGAILANSPRIDATRAIIRTKASKTKHHGGSRDIGEEKSTLLVQSANLIKNRNVLLLDDIVTTGCSLQASRELLARAGAHHVKCAVIAKTVRDNEQPFLSTRLEHRIMRRERVLPRLRPFSRSSISHHLIQHEQPIDDFRVELLKSTPGVDPAALAAVLQIATENRLAATTFEELEDLFRRANMQDPSVPIPNREDFVEGWRRAEAVFGSE
jgi:HAD superfamily hydrolase (TIGR01549 family)